MLSLDDDELRAAATLLTGVAPDDELAASVAVGRVRLRARGLLSGPEALTPPQLADAVRLVLGTWLWADETVRVSVSRRDAQSGMSIYWRGGTFVAHRRDTTADGELHLFQAFDQTEQVVEYLLDALDAPDQHGPFETRQLGLDALERARAAAAAGDRFEVALALQSAGAETTLRQELTDALLTPRCIAQLLCAHKPRRSLTLLISGARLWTFGHAEAVEEVEAVEAAVMVDRPSRATLRKRLATLWTT